MENEVAIKEIFDYFYVNKRELTASQEDFINGCKKYFRINKQLSDKQLGILCDMKRFLNVENVIK